MNVDKIKKIIKRIGVIVLLIIAVAFTGAFVFGKVRDTNAGNAIREELRSQTVQIEQLERSNVDLQRVNERLELGNKELERINSELESTNIRLQGIREAFERNNREFTRDISDLEEIFENDREAINRIREILQE